MTKRIYAADDDRHIRQVLQMFLTGAGYVLCLFEDSDTLYQAFVEKPCDLVILDVMMPGTDGMRVCEKLRPVRRAHHHPDGQGQRDKLRRGLLLRRGRLHHQAFRPSLLVMKIGALLKRVEQSAQQGEASGQLHYGDISTLMKRSSPAAEAWRSR